MTEIVISPPLPKWVLDTFEGKFIAHWIGYTGVGDDKIQFEGDTENEDDEDIILLRMDPPEVEAFAQLGEEAGTEICQGIARLLRDPEGTEVMSGFYDKIDISATVTLSS